MAVVDEFSAPGLREPTGPVSSPLSLDEHSSESTISLAQMANSHRSRRRAATVPRRGWHQTRLQGLLRRDELMAALSPNMLPHFARNGRCRPILRERPATSPSVPPPEVSDQYERHCPSTQ